MKRDFSVILKDYKGEKLTADLLSEGKPKDLILSEVCEFALKIGKNKERAGTEAVSYAEKRKRNLLAKKIYRSVKRKEPCDISSEEITMLKDICGELYASDIIGAIDDVLEDVQEPEEQQAV